MSSQNFPGELTTAESYHLSMAEKAVSTQILSESLTPTDNRVVNKSQRRCLPSAVAQRSTFN